MTGRGVAWLGFGLGIAASVAANVAHADPATGPRVAAAFWPLALLLAVEVLTRVQWSAGVGYALARYAGVGAVATVAAVMSYRHMAALLARYGEDGFGAHLGPLGVDGLMVVSGVALLSEAARRAERSAERAGTVPAAVPVSVPATPVVPPAPETVPAVPDGMDDEAAREAAQRRWLEAERSGTRLTGAALGREFGRTDRWGRAQVQRAQESQRHPLQVVEVGR